MFANKAHEKGYNLLNEGRYEEALVQLKKAEKETPDHPDVQGDLGVAYIHLGNKPAVFTALNKAVELQPDYGYRYAARAYAKDFFGDLDGAISDYRIAIQKDPEDAVAHNNLGLLLEKKGYQAKAAENFRRADELSKIENELFDVMDKLEGTSNEKKETPKPNTIDPTEKRRENVSHFREFKKIFTSREQFNEFIRFIRNGFKLPK